MAKPPIEKVRELIREDSQKGLKDWQIAKKIGVSPANITKWMNQDVEPTHESLKKLLSAYNLPKTYFFDDVDGVDLEQREFDDLDILIMESLKGLTREEKRSFIDHIQDQKLLKEIKKLKRA